MTIEHEVLDRTVRIESRIVQLGLFLGVDLVTREAIEVTKEGQRYIANLPSADVALSRIVDAVNTARWHGPSEDCDCRVIVRIRLKGDAYFAEMTLPPLR